MVAVAIAVFFPVVLLVFLMATELLERALTKESASVRLAVVPVRRASGMTAEAPKLVAADRPEPSLPRGDRY